MPTTDQITALAPDAASLKAGRDLATSRKWKGLGSDGTALWGLALGSGAEPYQTRVHLADLASKCSCPSRKFPCKHALGLLLLASAEPASLTEKSQPRWVVEWLESRAAREQKPATSGTAKPAKPADDKAAQKRRDQRDSRIREGVEMLQQALLDMTREGLASASARNPATWENLAKRMVDAQAPRLAGNLQYLAEQVLHDPDADVLLPLELGRLYFLLHCIQHRETFEAPMQAELRHQLGSRGTEDADAATTVADSWLVAGRRTEERERLLTSSTWLLGKTSRQWALVLRFAVLPQTIAEPWPLGGTVQTSLAFPLGLYLQRALPQGDGIISMPPPEPAGAEALTEILQRFAAALAVQPFLRSIPFLSLLRPDPSGTRLVDSNSRMLPWRCHDSEALLVETICAHRHTLMCGEWDGLAIRLLAIADGQQWLGLTNNPGS